MSQSYDVLPAVATGFGDDMRDRADRVWRIFGTGLSFCVFGVAGLVLGVLIFPLTRLLLRDAHSFSKLSREVIAWSFRRFIGLMNRLGVIRYELVGFEKLNRNGLLVLANHPSLIDTVFLLGFVSNSTCVVDEQLFKNSFMAGSLRAAGFIRNSAGTDVLSQCTGALDAGLNVLIFPEGTRTPLSGVIRLRRGAANIAVRAERNVTPVVVRCTPRTLVKEGKWWKVPQHTPFFSLHVGDDIAVSSFSDYGDSPALAVRRLTACLEQYFTSESGAHAVP